MSKSVVEISDREFKEKVLQSDRPVMVDLWAPWCGPCRMVGPIVEELAEDYGDKIAVYKMNIDDNTDTAAEYGVTSIPTILLFKDGEELTDRRMVGARSKDDYEDVLDELIQ